MDLHEIVNKLIGKTNPIGCSDTDEERFKNLVEKVALVDELIGDLRNDAKFYAGSHESSVKRCGVYAERYLQQLKEN